MESSDYPAARTAPTHHEEEEEKTPAQAVPTTFHD